MEVINLREKFLKNGIPYDDIDPEMIEILDVLNFGLRIKTTSCCIGHQPKQPTSIMLDNGITDEQVYMLLSVVDWNVGTSGVKGTKLYKWARIMYQPYFKPPHYPKTNWVLEISGREDYTERMYRLERITEELKNLWDCRKSELG